MYLTLNTDRMLGLAHYHMSEIKIGFRYFEFILLADRLTFFLESIISVKSGFQDQAWIILAGVVHSDPYHGASFSSILN